MPRPAIDPTVADHPFADEGEKRYWKVRVDCVCEYRKPNAKLGAKPVEKEVRRWLLVRADGSHAAMLAAEEHASHTADFGPRWLSFQAVLAYSCDLPLELTPKDMENG